MNNQSAPSDDQTIKNNEQVQTFAASKIAQRQITIGAILIIVGLLCIGFTGAGGAPLGFGILNIILACVMNNDEYVTLGHDYMALKAPLRGKTYVLFSEITSIDKDDKKITIFYHIHGDNQTKERKMIIVLDNIDAVEKQRLIEAFNKILVI